MAERKTTSTFIIHHDRCDPSKWTAADVLTLADYVRTGDLCDAAALSRRLSMQLVRDERHEAAGGTLERIGVAPADDLHAFAETIDELDLDEAVCEIVPIYRGPSEYAVRYGIGDYEGNFEGYEYEVKATEAEAVAYNKTINDETPAPSPSEEK